LPTPKSPPGRGGIRDICEYLAFLNVNLRVSFYELVGVKQLNIPLLGGARGGFFESAEFFLVCEMIIEVNTVRNHFLHLRVVNIG
tara:strand:+ start:195 stop:449 length:255 start_codon:yes stop_codon:yes gene_type:complete